MIAVGDFPPSAGVTPIVSERGSLWRWRCACGSEFIRETWAVARALRIRQFTSCGCLLKAARSRNGKANAKPGTLTPSERWQATKGTDAYQEWRAGYIKREDVKARWRTAANTETARLRQNERRRQDATHRARRAKAERERRANDPQARLSHRVSSSVKRGLTSGKSGVSWKSLLGFSLFDLRRHLERQFLPGMSWQNMGLWHIDHIRPLSSFSFRTASDEGFKEAWALTNLRPLWAADNIRKHSKRLVLI